MVPPDIRNVAEEFGWKKAFLVNRLKPVQTARASRKVHMKLQEEGSNKGLKEDRKKLALVM